MAICEDCEKEVSEKVEKYSKEHFYGRVLCVPCQNKVRAGGDSGSHEGKKEEEEKKGTLDGFGSGDEGDLGEYDIEVVAELEAESKELEEKIRQLIPQLSMPEKDNFYTWLKSEYDVVVIDDLDVEGKRHVLENMKKAIEDKEKTVEEEEGSEWKKTVEVDEGTFMFREEGGKLFCKNIANGNVYALKIEIPECTCGDFEINKEKQEWCKHLKAASIAGYKVSPLSETPKEVKALVKPEKEKQRRGKAKKEETVAIEVLGKRVELAVQTPQEIIQNEVKAAEMIKTILGPNPKREDVIEEYGDIKEIAADVIVSLAQYSGIRFQPFIKETEVVKINLGKVFKAIPMSKDKKEQYGPLADFIPDTDVTVRCKITSIAGWRDKKGDLHFGMGTKEEHLTPYKLKDIATRGANFIETMCETKSAKKSILGCLPITHDGLLRKIEGIYGWK